MSDVLVAEDVARTYGDTVALDGVSLTVGEGEVFALIGPNGAGKTTLVRSLTGTTDAEGTVRLFGQPPQSVARSRLGLLPQSFDPPDRLSARELLDYYGGLYDDARATETVLDDVGLTDSAETAYEDLSGGQQRRVCVGTALINDPDLVVLDEPTTGIDPAGRRAVWGLLESLADGGTTILLTTHYMAEAEHLADRVGFLSDGRLVALDTPQALIDAHGGETRLSIELESPPPERVDLGYETSLDEDRLVVTNVPPTEIGTVVDQLTDAGVVPASLTWREPDLEDVYLDLTGTSLGYGGDALDDEADVADPVAAEGVDR